MNILFFPGLKYVLFVMYSHYNSIKHTQNRNMHTLNSIMNTLSSITRLSPIFLIYII